MTKSKSIFRSNQLSEPKNGSIRCNDLRSKIQLVSDGEYAAAKHQVDSLRAELGMAPLPSLQQTMAEKSAS